MRFLHPADKGAMDLIREMRREDLAPLAHMIRATTAVDAETVTRRLQGGKAWVLDDGGIRGCGSLSRPYPSESGGRIDVWLFTDPRFRRRGVASRLWETMLPHINASGAAVVETGYRADQGDARSFFASRGFEKWFARDTLRYSGPPLPEPAEEPRKLDLPRVREFMELVNDCFSDLRAELDIVPHAPYPDPAGASGETIQQLLSNGECTFLFLDGGHIASAGEIVGPDHIDLVAVHPAHRRKGLGSLITGYCVNRLRERGASTVLTSVVDINAGARRMYDRLGFEFAETYEEARLWLHR